MKNFLLSLFVLSSSHVFAKDKANLILGTDPERKLSIQITGSKGGVAEELSIDLKKAYSNGTAFLVDEGDHYLYVMREMRAYVNKSETNFKVILDSQISGTVWESIYQEGINKGLISNFQTQDLKNILKGDVDGEDSEKLITGKFIRCKWNGCEISLDKTIEVQTEAKNCEFHIDRIATLNMPNVEKSFQSVVLTAKVRSDLKDKVVGMYFNTEKMTQIKEMEGFYSIELNTTGLQCGTGPLKNKGILRMRLNDGRLLIVKPSGKDSFTIDPFFAKNIKTKIDTRFDELMIKSLKPTADLFSVDGSAKYVNPNQCR